MKAVALAALLVAACAGGPGATPPPGTPGAVTGSATPAVVSSTRPTASPAASSALRSMYTPDDEEIAKLIRAGADAAIPQLKQLSRMDPSSLEDLFVPLGVWIDSQLAEIESLDPSTCTATAVDLFMDGMDAYDDIRLQFLAWRDWGANGHAFPPGAPNKTIGTIEDAVAELAAQCHA